MTREGRQPESIVAEVTNMPLGESATYVLSARNADKRGKGLRYRDSKALHVSPFMPMDMEYEWCFTNPGKRLAIHMANLHKGQRVFDTAVVLDRTEISATSLASTLIRFPVMTAKVIAAIHWQALRLWLKRCPVTGIRTSDRRSRFRHDRTSTMKSLSVGSSEFLDRRRKPSGFDQFARGAVRSRMQLIQNGQLVVCENGRHDAYGSLTDEMPLTTLLTINDTRFYPQVAFGGVLGAAEAWMQGYWTCGELTDLVRILLRNRHVLTNLNAGAAVFARPLQSLLHRLNRNTRAGNRRNVAAHYDLGNDFYALWLDRTMMYSSAIFERSDMSLEEASVAKLDRICRKLSLQPGDRVLEIGTGWGGFAIHAAKHYGCHVTTTTISERQCDYARDRVRREGLHDRVKILDVDYRELEGRFDKLVSVEMIEAVGREYQQRFFSKCGELLTADGQMLLQSITIADQNFDSYRSSVDFIRRYVFPGGCLTSVTSMLQFLTSATDMRLVHLEDIAPHYARTIGLWRERFEANLDSVRALGYPEEFVRMWQYYFSYCEGAFLERAIGNVQMHLVKPKARPDVVAF